MFHQNSYFSKISQFKIYSIRIIYLNFHCRFLRKNKCSESSEKEFENTFAHIYEFFSHVDLKANISYMVQQWMTQRIVHESNFQIMLGNILQSTCIHFISVHVSDSICHHLYHITWDSGHDFLKLWLNLFPCLSFYF